MKRVLPHLFLLTTLSATDCKYDHSTNSKLAEVAENNTNGRNLFTYLDNCNQNYITGKPEFVKQCQVKVDSSLLEDEKIRDFNLNLDEVDYVFKKRELVRHDNGYALHGIISKFDFDYPITFSKNDNRVIGEIRVFSDEHPFTYSLRSCLKGICEQENGLLIKIDHSKGKQIPDHQSHFYEE